MKEGWNKEKLANVFSFHNGKKIKPNGKGEYIAFGSNGPIGNSEKTLFDSGIIIGRVGAYCGSVFMPKEPFWASDNTIVVRVKEGYDQNFMSYYLSLLNLNWYAGGSAQPLLSHGWLKPIKINLPSLPIQCKIASILSAYDDLIENNLKRIKLLEEQAQLTYEEWFVRMKFPGHETATFDEETGLPEGWEKVKVIELLGKIKTTKKIKSSEILEEGTIPVVDQSRTFIKGFTNDNDALIKNDKSIIVFGDHTRVLKFINFPFARGADGTQVILSKNERMPQHLFYFILKDVDLSNYHYARHFKFLKDSEVILPTKFVAEKFEKIAKKNYDLILSLQNQNHLLKEARDILLPRLMSGMIDVDGLDVDGSLSMVPEEIDGYKKG
jgi:type I restriction enzyme S subunit